MSKTVYSNHGKFQNQSKPPRKRRRKVSPLRVTLLVLCAVILLTVLGIGGFVLHNNLSENKFQKMAEQSRIAATAPVTLPAPTEDPLADPAETTAPTTPTIPTNDSGLRTAAVDENRPVLPQYQELYAQNKDLFGWVTIPGSKIDYPVMYTPGESEKYLHTGFDGSNSYPGVPFIDINCQPESQNLLIYGHNMPNGSMFRDLMKYQEKTYWQKHPTITFNTLYEEREYEIVAAFNDRIYRTTETDVFKFYYFIDPETEEEFNDGIAAMKNKALYDTGVTAEYGDKLITLITCAYHTDHGRFVVLARQK